MGVLGFRALARKKNRPRDEQNRELPLCMKQPSRVSLRTAHDIKKKIAVLTNFFMGEAADFARPRWFNHSNCKKDHGHSRMTMVIRCRPPLASHWQRVAGGFARPAAVYGWGLDPFKLHEQPHRPAIAGGSSSMAPGLKVGDEVTARAGKVNDDEWMKGALKGKGWGRTEIEGRVRSFVCGTGGKHGKWLVDFSVGRSSRACHVDARSLQKENSGASAGDGDEESNSEGSEQEDEEGSEDEGSGAESEAEDEDEADHELGGPDAGARATLQPTARQVSWLVALGLASRRPPQVQGQVDVQAPRCRQGRQQGQTQAEMQRVRHASRRGAVLLHGVLDGHRDHRVVWPRYQEELHGLARRARWPEGEVRSLRSFRVDAAHCPVLVREARGGLGCLFFVHSRLVRRSMLVIEKRG